MFVCQIPRKAGCCIKCMKFGEKHTPCVPAGPQRPGAHPETLKVKKTSSHPGAGREESPTSTSKGFLAFLPSQKVEFLPSPHPQPTLILFLPHHTQHDLGGKLSKRVTCGSMYFIKLMWILIFK